MYRISLGILALALALASCSTAPAPDINWQDGAKHGWVSQIYSSATPKQDIPACLASLSPAELDQRHFVRISYRHVRRMLVEVAELPEGDIAKIDDRVELWPADCDKGKLSRISRVMPQKPSKIVTIKATEVHRQS